MTDVPVGILGRDRRLVDETWTCLEKAGAIPRASASLTDLREMTAHCDMIVWFADDFADSDVTMRFSLVPACTARLVIVSTHAAVLELARATGFRTIEGSLCGWLLDMMRVHGCRVMGRLEPGSERKLPFTD
jgi:hypothetical protein